MAEITAEEKLAELCLRQFVRNTMVEVLTETCVILVINIPLLVLLVVTGHLNPLTVVNAAVNGFLLGFVVFARD